MRIKFVATLITLLSLAAVNAREEACPSEGNPSCSCGPKYHSVVSFMDPAFKRTFCGGTIINHKQVLTLAQCVAGRNLNEFVIVVKLRNVSRVEKMSVHDPESVIFHIEPPHGGRDVAIVNIPQTLYGEDANGIVCLPFCYPTDRFFGHGFRAMGWYRPPGRLRGIMSGGPMTLTADGHCVNDNRFLMDKCMCVEEGKHDFVEYQGGEPVYWDIEDDRQMQIGIIIPRFFCHDQRATAVLRIGLYVDWIESHAPKVCRSLLLQNPVVRNENVAQTFSLKTLYTRGQSMEVIGKIKKRIL